MAITSAATTLTFNSVLTSTIDNINYIALIKSSGEFFRKTYSEKTMLTSSKCQYTFYLTESEGNDAIVQVELNGNGATATLDSGTDFATQTLILTKTSNQSLTIVWTLELI